jgi:poly-beta-1,6 N-acetyl-D-glucosamine synthase
MRPRPIFHDPTGRRRRWSQRLAVLLGSVFLAVTVLFVLSLVLSPALPPAVGINLMPRRDPHPVNPANHRERRLDRFLLGKAHRKLLTEIAADERESRRLRAKPPPDSGVTVAAFYAIWQETGLHSLRANADRINLLLPAWLRLGADAASLDTRDWNPQWVPHNKDVLKICRDHHIKVMPVLANAHEGAFDTDLARQLLTSPARQRRLSLELRDWLRSHGFAGVNIDFENLSAADAERLPAFLARLRRTLEPAHLALTCDLEVEGNVPDAAAVARESDLVILMAYDQHYMTGEPGPLCGFDWFREALDRTLRGVPRSKLVLGYGSYAYDWTIGKTGANSLTYQEALFQAADNYPDERPEQIVDFDSLAMNATYTYDDDDGKLHEVWMLDAVSGANERTLALTYGVRNAAVWVLGSEDPGMWTYLDRRQPGLAPDSLALARSSFPYDVEFDGDGEILTVTQRPRRGERALERDAATGLFTDMSYKSFPAPYVLKRRGFRDHTLALTFDDGPSSPYTGRVLDELRDLGVHGTFFVIGENAERHPDLIGRMWREGHEIGNHTFTHPNLAAIPEAEVNLELNATQRVIQSDVGRSTLLFRPPYNADAEPTSAEEVAPILAAAKLGYITIGEYLDPQDWRLFTTDPGVHDRTAEDIADEVIDDVGRGHGNTILLHDGGGDRSRTIEAIRIFVPELKRRGYRFVTVSELAGASRDAVMPPVSPRDRALLGTDRLTFEVLYLFETFLRWASLLGIVLGTGRVLFVTVLALVARRRERRRATPAPPTLRVSVLIAAYNERPVIARTLAAVLGSTHPPHEVVVVDDGSTDGTAEEVDRHHRGDPRVRLVRQENTGKAAALNRAIELSEGEVLVCLDADTLFRSDTLERLVRHFADPEVGAVAGNVKVGNRINLWTKWQAIEYITSQNLDRRAYALLNAITVVPGAVGAWRRDAVRDTGGYRNDTLAEDMDLTWRIRRRGWRIYNDTEALGFTEAPDHLSALFKQRFRWAFGTLQCLWKHRGAIGRYGWFGRLALPSMWLFQILFQVVSPLIDLQVAWTLIRVAEAYLTRGLLTRDWQPLPQAVGALWDVAALYTFFVTLELLAAIVAFRLEREKPRLLVWVFWQRFVYRQLMYAVVLRALRRAVQGVATGWGKLERKGTATVQPAA